MRGLFTFVIFLSPLTHALAADLGESPTELNWTSFSPEICAPDPEDPLALRPIIFPAQYRTYKDDKLPDHYAKTELMVAPRHTDENGNVIPTQIVDRLVPWMYNGPSYRILTQFLGYLNKDDLLVDRDGIKISDDNKLQPEPSENHWGFEDYDTEIVISEDLPQETIKRNDQPTHFDFFYKMHDAPNCSFWVEYVPAQFDNIKVQKRVAESPFACKAEGGFFTPPPITRTITKRRLVNSYGKHILIKDHTGYIKIWDMFERREDFNNLMKDGTCDWEQLK